MRNILVATDLTINSAHAMDRAIQLADVTQARLHVFHQAPDFRLPGTKQNNEDLFSNAAKSKITEFIQQNKRSANITFEIHIESKGRIHELIDEHAMKIQADLVVMGITNKSKDTPSFVSTTIERVIKTGNYPVLMVSRKVTGLYQKALFYLDMDDLSGAAFNLASQFNPKADFLLLPAFNVLTESSDGLWSRFRMKRYNRRTGRFIDEAKEVLKKHQGNPEKIQYHDIRDRGANLLLAEAQKQETDLVCIDLHRYTASLHLKVKGFAGKLLEHPPSDVLIMKRV